ncbi:TetR/AcrR family transcriptional regulator [Nocardia sp. NPDC058379]|uniref:TetR/AcrR family transcriptional regulator n=1 Tax=unclassified Nocardia TaxID=2637762 RepID=UPI003646344E
MAETLSRMQRRKLETRRDILDAAYECFAERGYHGTSIAHIVKKVGIAQGTFYLYFQTKRDIIDKVLDDLVDRLTVALAAIPPEGSATLADYRAQAEQLTDTLTRVLTEDPRATRLLLLQAAAVDDEMADRILSLHELAAAWQAGYLQHGVDAGYFRADLDVESAARAVNGMIFAAAMYQLRDPGAADIDRLTRTIRDIIYRALAAGDGA